MLIIGVPDDIDPAGVRPTSDWPLSARCEREHWRRDLMIAEARERLAELPDRELRVKVANELSDELQTIGGGDPPPGFPNAFAMTRNEMIDFLAECAVGYVPDIEVVYPGAIDPTA